MRRCCWPLAARQTSAAKEHLSWSTHVPKRRPSACPASAPDVSATGGSSAGHTALMEAALHGHTRIVRMLVQAGADVAAQTTGQNPGTLAGWLAGAVARGLMISQACILLSVSLSPFCSEHQA